MLLGELFDHLALDLAKVEVGGLAADSRMVRPGDVFFAVPGFRDDGSLYVEDALRRGAVAVVAQGSSGSDAASMRIFVPDMRQALAHAASVFNGEPSRSLKVFAVTGTNGKTTIAGLVRDIMSDAGVTCGLLSTVENVYPGCSEEASRTTPDPLTLQAHFAAMLRAGCGAASIEASSHALDQGRIAFTRIEAAGFTNLSQDHFDYHHTFEDYFLAKRHLFEQLGELNHGGHAVINADDPYGARLISEASSLGITPLPYSLADGTNAAIRASGIRMGTDGTAFILEAFGERREVSIGLLGRYNVSNALCAIGMAVAGGVALDSAIGTITRARPRWGRLEKVADIGGAAVFVDYAHTPDAIGKVLDALRELTSGRLIIVFGCGGDRDRGKRPLMAKVASEKADFAILTSDNPRTEDPERIMDDAEAGFTEGGAAHARIADRREAIALGIGMLHDGDTLVIAGKGHETYQEICGVKHPFDDRAIASDAIRASGGGVAHKA